MTDVDQRSVLERLIRERREDYVNLSRLLGRNPAYVQQFIKRGIPRQLAERDRRRLATYFNIHESDLGGPARSDSELRMAAGQVGFRPVPRFELGASAGAGAFAEDERPVAHIGFDPAWLRRLTSGSANDLSIIRVDGDSMHPTLSDGDDILVDRGDAVGRLRDGVYVLRRDDTLMVKRLGVHPSTRLITIRSDNAAYPTWPDCKPQSVDIIGRVVWAGRKVG